MNIKNQVYKLGPWYQKIDLGDGVVTATKAVSGEYLWKQVEKLLETSLVDKRILDLGCNAGIFCIESILSGAKEVVGIEYSTKYFNQANFIKEYFEKKYNRPLNIKYIKSDIIDVNFNDLGLFDYVFAFSILYHIGKKFGKGSNKKYVEEKRVINILSKLSNSIIIRSKSGGDCSTEHYDQLFKDVGFTNVKNKTSGKRSFVLYKRT